MIHIEIFQGTEKPLSWIGRAGQYSWLITLVGLVIALRGWRVAYNNSIKLATRSESKSIVDAISKLVIETSELSIEFWLEKSAKSDNSSIGPTQRVSQSSSYLHNVLAKGQQISKLSDILKQRGLVIPSSMLAEVLEKATLDCETAYRLDTSSQISRSQEIVDACMNFVSVLYETFQYYHPPAK